MAEETVAIEAMVTRRNKEAAAQQLEFSQSQ
jgi:hypothetical protein